MKNWNTARETTAGETPMGDAVPVDPGAYVMQLVSAEIDDYADKRQVMLKWAVISDDENSGAICTEWEGLFDAERLVWLQRKLAALGVDLNEVSIETEKDLETLLDELINDGTCAKVRVKEKDNYINMQTRAATDVEESDLFDPEEILKGEGSAAGAEASADNANQGDAAKKPDDSGQEYDFKEGETVTFQHDGKELTGVIQDFTDDDEAKLKIDGRKRTLMKRCDDLTPAKPMSQQADEAQAANEESKGEGGDPFKKGDLKVGDRVVVDFGSDGTVEGEITSVPPGRKQQVQFTGDDTKEPELIPAADIVRRLEAIKPSDDSKSGDSKGGDEPWNAGDDCQFMDGRKQMQGVVRDIEGDVARIKCEGTRKLFSIPVDKLEDRA
jgi:hypothetical protein